MQAAGRTATGDLIGWRAQLRDLVAVGWLFLATGAVYIVLVMGTTARLDAAQEAFLRLFVLPSLPLAAVVCLIRAREVIESFLRLPFLGLFLVLMWSSVTWSVDPAISLRRALVTTAYTLIALWLVVAYDPRALLARLAWLSLSNLLLTVAFAVFLPSIAFMEFDNQLLLRGVFSHKNVLGQHLAMSGILLLTAWQCRLMPRWAAGLGLGLCGVLAVPTGSATAMVILAGLAMIRLVTAILALPGRQATVLMLLGIGAACFVVMAALLSADMVFAVLDRDPTLTGRVPLWEFVWQQIGHSPWLGYGFAVFFTIDWVNAYTMEALVWSIPNAHNGYLELWLGVGVAGPIVVTLFLVLGLARALAQLTREATPAALFAVYFIPIYLLRNIVESDLAEPSTFSWVLAAIATAMTTRPVDDRHGATNA